VIIGAFIMLLTRQNKISKIILYLTVILGILFFTLGFLRDRNIESNINEYSKLNGINSMMLTGHHYISGSYGALNDYINGDLEVESFSVPNVMPAISKLIKLINQDVKVNNYKYELSYNLPATNVYSSYKEIHHDFGWIGSIIIYLLLGIIIGILYKLTQYEHPMFTIIILSILYCYIVYSIFYSIFLFMPIFLTMTISIIFKNPK
jgi:oligosaccharide repeat unit polymerase